MDFGIALGMAQFWKHVNEVMRRSDIVLEVLDARMVEETRNKEIEDKILRFGKKILFVLNKCDLVDLERLKAQKKELHPCVFVSSKDKLGTTILKKKILELSHGEPVIVGVVGYPNVGKSSVINALSGRHAARTSAESGYTKGVQKVKVDNKIMLIDTPGVFPQKEKDQFKHGMTGAVSYEKIKDPETVALQIIEAHLDKIKLHYQVEGEDAEGVLQQLAQKWGKVGKGGRANLDGVSRAFLKEWQEGKATA